MIPLLILFAFSLVQCPLIEKEGEISAPASYLDLGKEDDLNTVQLERGAIANYKLLGYGSVTAFQRDFLQENNPFKLALIPFRDDKSSLLQQLGVFKSLLWGPACLTDAKLEEERKTFPEVLPVEEQVGEGVGHDVFCKENVLAKQTLWEGKTVRLLYPTSVLPEEEHAAHFLVVTKHCRPDFSALTDEEALEVESVTRRLFAAFKAQGYAIGIKLQKNGSVGVTVPHFHQHVIFFKEAKEEQQALYKMIRNVFFGSGNLSDQQFRENFQYFKDVIR